MIPLRDMKYSASVDMLNHETAVDQHDRPTTTRPYSSDDRLDRGNRYDDETYENPREDVYDTRADSAQPVYNERAVRPYASYPYRDEAEDVHRLNSQYDRQPSYDQSYPNPYETIDKYQRENSVEGSGRPFKPPAGAVPMFGPGDRSLSRHDDTTPTPPTEPVYAQVKKDRPRPGYNSPGYNSPSYSSPGYSSPDTTSQQRGHWGPVASTEQDGHSWV